MSCTETQWKIANIQAQLSKAKTEDKKKILREQLNKILNIQNEVK